ncbi:DUF4846 domain-containing protein [Fulvitalea axinellae]
MTFPDPDPVSDKLASRIPAPSGFVRVEEPTESFASFLNALPLKSAGEPVRYYNDKVKSRRGVYCAVVDLPIGDRDLHQCADAVMRLRAEYLWKHKRYDEIHFNTTSGFRLDYSKWMTGNRLSVKGNECSWVKRKKPSNSYLDFWSYMETVFSYAGTYSLSKELKPTNVSDLKIGDVFIQGGFPGHAVIVVGKATHSATGQKIFLLAQSYMPAQELQILVNPNDPKLSPWYPLNFGERLVTPEWTFKKTDLKRF